MIIIRTATAQLRRVLQVVILCAGFGGMTVTANAAGGAEIVFRNGAVYTVNTDQPWAEAIAIDSGRIVAVGSNADMAAWLDDDTQVVDLNGKMLLPGFGDAHVHPAKFDDCDLAGIVDREEMMAAIVDCAAYGDQDDWITGGRWEGYVFEGGKPDKSILDNLVPGRPVFLMHAHAHDSWASSRALEIAGITKDTPDPVNGRIDRDRVTGEPTGLLHEHAAAHLITKFIPPPADSERAEALRSGLEMANSFGITTLQDARTDRGELGAYATLEDRGDLNIRAVTTILLDNTALLDDVERIIRLREEFDGDRFKATAVKLFLDGVIYQHTAPLLEPYTDRPDHEVKPNIDPEMLNKIVARLDAYGFQIHIHAVGDYTVRIALDALEHARNVNGERDSRHQIAHMDLIHPDDRKRFAELDVVANFQPFWARPDPMITDFVLPRVGEERVNWSFPIGSVVKSGGKIAFGSDWTVSTINPLDGIEVAVTRRLLGDTAGDVLMPEDRIDLSTAIAAATLGVAYVNFLDRETGSIKPGKYADVIVLDRNLFDLKPHQIHEAKVLLTLLDGESVYESEEWKW